MKTQIDKSRYSLMELYRAYAYMVYNRDKSFLKSRWKKKLLRLIFNAWYKTADENGEFNEEYWKLTFDDGVKVRIFLFDNIKGLTQSQSELFLRELFRRKK